MADTKKTFLIVDGHALLHRAWHALPPLTTKDGVVISGAYGFTTILLKAIRELRPTHVAVTLDLKGPTFRHQEFVDYKAKREKKPDELYAQVPLIEKILKAMRIPVFTKEGFEADDVIGSLARLAAESDSGVETVIVTGDMDTLQLVDERTKVYTLRKGMTDTVLYDIAAVRERFGFMPIQLIDYKALRGDPSDNIPGVKGIGEKTGSELIRKFGSIERIYQALDQGSADIKPAVQKKLAEHKKEAVQAKRLCTIVRGLPLDFDLDSCAYRPVTRAMVADVFNEFQFTRLLQQLPADESLFGQDMGPVSSAAMTEAESATIAGKKDFLAALREFERAAEIAFHTLTETDAVLSPEILAFGISDGRHSVVIDGGTIASVSDELRGFLGNRKIRKICHDLKREIGIFSAYSIEISGQCFDLQLASYLLFAGERRHSLESLVALRAELATDGKKMDTPEKISLLGRQIPHFIPMARDLEKQISENGMDDLYAKIELPTARVLAAMQLRGVAIDIPYLKDFSGELGGKIDELSAAIIKFAGGDFNINSPSQLQVVLFDKLNISAAGIKKTAKGGSLSTAASELEKLRGVHPIIEKILEYREAAKLKSTYVDALPELVHPKSGRIHASFNQTVTATGRLSSSNPNLQNIPTVGTEYGKKVRNAFIAGRGHVFLAADYSQIELRIAAHLADEKTMIMAFKNGEDIHWRTAAEMWGEDQAKDKRRIAKIINFGILYGMGPMRLAEAAGISFDEAREYIDRYFGIHAGISAYVEATKQKAYSQGYVETMFGRKRFFRNLKLMNRREQAEAERQAVNMPIQGTQADMIKLAMVRIEDALRLAPESLRQGVKMVLQVHDELVFEVAKDCLDEAVALIRPLMEGVIELKVPIVVNLSSGARWGEMSKLEQSS